MIEKTFLCDERDMFDFQQEIAEMTVDDVILQFVEILPDFCVSILTPDAPEVKGEVAPRAMIVMCLTKSALEAFLTCIPKEFVSEARAAEVHELMIFFESNVNHETFNYFDLLCEQKEQESDKEGDMLACMHKIKEGIFMDCGIEEDTLELIISDKSLAQKFIGFATPRKAGIPKEWKNLLLGGQMVIFKDNSDISLYLREFMEIEDFYNLIALKVEAEGSLYGYFEDYNLRLLSSLEVEQFTVGMHQAYNPPPSKTKNSVGTISFDGIAEGVDPEVVDIAPVYDDTSYGQPVTKDFDLEGWALPITNAS